MAQYRKQDKKHPYINTKLFWLNTTCLDFLWKLLSTILDESTCTNSGKPDK